MIDLIVRFLQSCAREVFPSLIDTAKQGGKRRVRIKHPGPKKVGGWTQAYKWPDAVKVTTKERENKQLQSYFTTISI